MSLKSSLIKLLAKSILRPKVRSSQEAVQNQHKILKELIERAESTRFGIDHAFSKIGNYFEFKKQVPARDYEELKSYFELTKEAKSNILWPEIPKYLSKTSGTTSGSKYIPITNQSINHHIKAARNALFHYCIEQNNFKLFNGKMIFLQGSPALKNLNGIHVGRLSGIVFHHVPSWLTTNRKPSYDANCIEDWEQKVDAIVEETIQEDMRLISGIPPWVIMYLEKLLEKSGKKSIKDVFPNLSVFIHGGVNYKPYQNRIDELMGFEIPTIETYPASEGFIAYQNSLSDGGLLLNTDARLFFEFVELGKSAKLERNRLMLNQVELHKNYELIISSNAGLWAYQIGDCIEFTSLDPYKIKVTGRVKHFISGFGEHVIASEVEQAMQQACSAHNAIVAEFHVAPYIAADGDDSYHEWFIEFEKEPEDLDQFQRIINQSLCEQNSYYQDLIKGKMLVLPKMTKLRTDGFLSYQKQKGKLGGQNKVVRLANNREIANELRPYIIL